MAFFIFLAKVNQERVEANKSFDMSNIFWFLEQIQIYEVCCRFILLLFYYFITFLLQVQTSRLYLHVCVLPLTPTDVKARIFP